jgi:nitrogen fixation NifU-like protein
MTESGERIEDSERSRTIEEMYKEVILDHWRSPQNKGLLEEFDMEGHVVNQACGDAILLRLKFTDGRVAQVSFDGEGCAISQASASLLTETIKGQTTRDLLGLNDRDVLNLLQIEVIPSRLKCALLPLGAIRVALSPQA